jgi:Fe-S oxidoreductase
MCPSYHATREEMHSTRGRARLLFEMLHGDPVDGGWRDEHVREALDLCLACKGCKSECPANVDMATYRAEFLSHYYEGRLRPRAAYAMGLIPWWARLGSLWPEAANGLLQTPGLGSLVKWLGGVASEREAPRFAPQTFKSWFHNRPTRNPAAPPVLLWADAFTNHFQPEIAKAAVEVLEQAGFRVVVPEPALCCGRPLYDFGMLSLAKQFLRNILDATRDEIRAGTPVIGLEPSCAAVFRDELLNLFPDDFDARRLARQTFTLGGFLAQLSDYRPPRLERKALVHGHCHHKSVLKFGDEEPLYERMGLDYEIFDSGCCGMAGSFGFEAEHYDISMQIGEQRLLPAVRDARPDTLLVADGFSCRHQIAEGTRRAALHLAQVLQMALHEGPQGPRGGYPEIRYPAIRIDESERRRALWRTAAFATGGVALAAGATYYLSRGRSSPRAVR